MSGIVGNNLGRGSGLVKATAVVADSVSSASIVDDAIDSEHYTDASIDNAHLADNAVDTAEIADNAVTLAKMAGGTDGNIISFDASGDPVAIATGDDGQVLTSTGAGSPPAFEAASGGNNTPSFLVYAPADTTIADSTYVKIQLATELFDTDSDYDNSTNYRFTPTTAGKYFFFAQTTTSDTVDFNDAFTMIYKNGSAKIHSNAPHFHHHTNHVSGILDMNGSSDYVELYLHNNTGGADTTLYATIDRTFFGGFKLL